MKALRLHADAIHARVEEALLSDPAAAVPTNFVNPRLTLEELPVPTPGPEDLLLRVSYSGLAGGDFSLLEAPLAYPGGAAPPVTIGHELSGIVAGYGSLLDDAFREAFPVGTPVTAEESFGCGRCSTCRAGRTQDCPKSAELGFSSDGTHAEYVTVPARVCWSLRPLVESVGLENALRWGALTGLYAHAFRSLFDDSGSGHAYRPGDRTLVIGAGPLGLATIDLLQATGAGDVQVLEIDPARRHLARELGASAALAPEDAPTLPGDYDWVIDAAGAPELVASILTEKAAPGVGLLFLARSERPFASAPERLRRQHAHVSASRGHAGDAYRRVIRLLAGGRLCPDALTREIVSLEEALPRLLLNRRGDGKILVQHGHA